MHPSRLSPRLVYVGRQHPPAGCPVRQGKGEVEVIADLGLLALGAVHPALDLDEHERQPLVVVDVRAEISSVGPRVEYVALHSRTVSGSFRSSGTALDARALSLTLNTSKSPTSTGLSNEMSSTSKNRGLSPPNK